MIFVAWLAMTMSVLFTCWFLDGMQIAGFCAGIGAAAVIGILNAFVKPIMQVIALPLLVVTLGFFQIIINAVIIYMAAGCLDGLMIDTFWWTAIWAGLIITISYHVIMGVIGAIAS